MDSRSDVGNVDPYRPSGLQEYTLQQLFKKQAVNAAEQWYDGLFPGDVVTLTSFYEGNTRDYGFAKYQNRKFILPKCSRLDSYSYAPVVGRCYAKRV